MRRVKVTLPGTITNLGTGLYALGLAVALHTTIEVSERTDSLLNVETTGEDAGRYPLGIRHPVILGMSRIFQRLERSVVGINVRIDNHIPTALGLGVETAFFVGGMIAANNLFGSPFKRAELLQIASKVTGRADQAVTSMVGGLTSSTLIGNNVIYRSFTLAPMKVVLVLPQLPDYVENTRGAVPDAPPMRDALHNLSRLPLLVEALKSGDLAFAGKVMDDRLFAPYRIAHIPGYEDVVEVAQLNGAASVSLCGSGPTLLALAANHHQKIAEAITHTFEDAGVTAKTWIVPIDTQGIVLSVAQTG